MELRPKAIEAFGQDPIGGYVAGPHVSLVDASRLIGGDVGAFALLERYASLTAVALEIGASPQHFSALFRRITGGSPSVWRAHETRRSS